MALLRERLAEAESSLKVAESSAQAGEQGQKKADSELRALKTKNDSLSAEVARLKAALSIYEAAQKDDTAIRESKVAMKARLGALEAEMATQSETVESLRAEVAAANERLARQATHYRDELRRLGAGSLPTSAEPRTAGNAASSSRRPSLAERMGSPRPVAVKPVAGADVDQGRTDSYLKALSGRGSQSTEQVVSLTDIASAAGPTSGTSEADTASPERQPPQEVAANASGKAAAASENAPRRRSSLLERISGASKSSS